MGDCFRNDKTNRSMATSHQKSILYMFWQQFEFHVKNNCKDSKMKTGVCIVISPLFGPE